ncbi:MAG: hypothetical protein M3R54_09905 [Chloroflexota bacterium]|nr:hypothetical protein [Chloroflexota bacterium]
MRVATRGVRLFVVAFALLVVGVASPAVAWPTAANAAVSIKDFAFSPPTVTIGVGQMVTWTNNDAAFHTGDGTAQLGQGQSASKTYLAAGTFTYHCAIHTSMTGTVIVQAAATPVPTTVPTPVPTPVPTVRTPQPTPVPTPQPTQPPTQAPTETPTAMPSAATSAPATTAPATVAVASPAAASGPATAVQGPANGGGPGPLIIGGALAIVAGLGALAWVLLRR